jgi:hypothetical protein
VAGDRRGAGATTLIERRIAPTLPKGRNGATTMHGPLAFLLFWLVALAVGTALVLAVLGGGIAWLAIVAVSALALLPAVMRRGRRRD